MKYLPLGLSVIAGGALGAAVKWSSSGKATTPPASSAPTKIAREALQPELPRLVSTDKLDNLRDPKAADRVSRITVWLIAAPLAEVRELWKIVSTERPSSQLLRELVMARWVALDPADALQSGKMSYGSSHVWSAWAAEDPQKAYQAALASGDELAIANVLQVMGAKDPDELFKLLQKGEIKNAISVAGLVNSFVAQRQFEKALDAAVLYGGQKTQVLTQWFKEDPAQALAWAQENFGLYPRYAGDSDPQMDAITSTHLEHVPALLAKMQTGELKERLEQSYLSALAGKDPQAALKFAREASSPRQKSRLLAVAGTTLARTNPRMAAEALHGILEDEPMFATRVSPTFYPKNVVTTEDYHPMDSFTRNLLQHMPGVAMDELMTAAGSKDREADAEEFAQRWMREDAWDFSAWLKDKPQGQLRDRLVISLAQRIVSESTPAYKEALDWLATAGNSGARDQQLAETLDRWHSTNPEALKDYLSSSTVPAVVREQAIHIGEN